MGEDYGQEELVTEEMLWDRIPEVQARNVPIRSMNSLRESLLVANMTKLLRSPRLREISSPSLEQLLRVKV